MSVDAILNAIEAAGEAEITRLRAEAESRVQHILKEAKHKVATVQEEARRVALQPASGERARRQYQAKLEALRIVGEIRNRLIQVALDETRRRLVNLRADPNYRLVLHRLVKEAIDALGAEEQHNSRPTLEIDPRDEALIHRVLDELGLDLDVTPALSCWGGVVVKSSDGRVAVTNTLESHLERATPFLRQDLAAFIEQKMTNAQEPGDVSVASFNGVTIGR